MVIVGHHLPRPRVDEVDKQLKPRRELPQWHKEIGHPQCTGLARGGRDAGAEVAEGTAAEGSVAGEAECRLACAGCRCSGWRAAARPGLLVAAAAEAQHQKRKGQSTHGRGGKPHGAEVPPATAE